MRVNIHHLVQTSLDELRPLIRPEQSEQAELIMRLLLAQIQPSAPTNPPGKPGRPSVGVTVHVGHYGCVAFPQAADAAKAIGLKPNTLNVRLSQSKGKYILQRQDPDTHEPMALIVERGLLAETNERAKAILEATPARKKIIKPKPLAPLEHDESGRVVTNRMKRFNPVENA